MNDESVTWEFVQQARDKTLSDPNEADRLLVEVQIRLLGEDESIRRWNLRQEWRLAQDRAAVSADWNPAT